MNFLHEMPNKLSSQLLCDPVLCKLSRLCKSHPSVAPTKLKRTIKDICGFMTRLSERPSPLARVFGKGRTSYFQSSLSSHLSRYLCPQNVLLCFHSDARGSGCQVWAMVVRCWTGHSRLTGPRFHIRSVSKGLNGIFWNKRAAADTLTRLEA